MRVNNSSARRAGAKRRTRFATVLSVTSLVDILSILLIFLLMSFAPEGAVIHAAQDLELPESTSPEKVEGSDLVLAVTERGVSVGEHMIAGLEDWKGQLWIPELGAAIGPVSEDDPAAASRRVLVQGDKTIPFDLLYAVLFTAHQVGYQKLALAAYEKAPDQIGGVQ
ncbi:MAG: hypothetical protein HKN20_14785 [Gemmatimonadetes bacterium]|nr:hypothetical protein [Gemmatimonadota bacterium]